MQHFFIAALSEKRIFSYDLPILRLIPIWLSATDFSN